MKRIYPVLGLISLVILVLSTGAHQASAPRHESQATSPDATQTNRPLRFLMVGLGQDMSRINDGIWHEDYEMIRLGAQAIADHPRVMPEEMAAIKVALGDQFPAFVGHDQAVHQTATQLAGVAEEHNMENILRLQSQLMQRCTSCHAAFREDVRNALY